MGELTDKAKGAVNEGVGKAKQEIGKQRNDPDQQAAGADRLARR